MCIFQQNKKDVNFFPEKNAGGGGLWKKGTLFSDFFIPSLKKTICPTVYPRCYLEKPHRKNISVHLGIARLVRGLNPCPDGLWHLFLGEMS